MRNLKRWVPLVSGAALALAVVLKSMGYEGPAGVLESLAGILGVSPDVIGDLAKVPAALAVLGGVFLKFRSMYEKARDEDKFIRGDFGNK